MNGGKYYFSSGLRKQKKIFVSSKINLVNCMKIDSLTDRLFKYNSGIKV